MAAICGGVGGAKLADGLARKVSPERLAVVVNTGDDFRRYGLHVSPDVDTVLYTLSGRASRETGWGIADDTSYVMDALGDVSRGGDHHPWFRLGDRDLATHLLRTAWLDEGLSLSEVTRLLARAYGVGPTVLPMTDDTACATFIRTAEGELPFQEWFVRRRCEPPALGIRYGRAGGGAGGAGGAPAGADGAPAGPTETSATSVGSQRADAATPTEAVIAAIRTADVIVICPSNPYLSIGPILSLHGIRELLASGPAPVVAVSPIVGGRAIKGPAARMLEDLAGEASSAAVAAMYRDFVDGMVIDSIDALSADRIGSLGLAVEVADTVMTDDGRRSRLATDVLSFGLGLRR